MVAGRPGRIGFGGRSILHHAEDVANAFITAARVETGDGRAFNVPGSEVSMEEVAQAIRDVVPDAEVGIEPKPLPFPESVDPSSFDRFVGGTFRPLSQGVADVMAHFRGLFSAGLITAD